MGLELAFRITSRVLQNVGEEERCNAVFARVKATTKVVTASAGQTLLGAKASQMTPDVARMMASRRSAPVKAPASVAGASATPGRILKR